MKKENRSKVKRMTEFSPDWKTKHSCTVATVRPPSVVSRYAVAAPLTPPLGLAYMASTLRKAGHAVQLVDSVGEKLDNHTLLDGQMLLRGIGYEDIPDYIHDKTDIIGISSMFSSAWPYDRRVIYVLLVFYHTILTKDYRNYHFCLIMGYSEKQQAQNGLG